MNNSYIALGYECNHKCLCCPLTTYDRLHKSLDFDLIKKQLEKQLFKSGILNNNKNPYSVHHVIVSGGEPGINKNFFNLIKLLNLYNFHITILSNASCCKDKLFVKNLEEALIDKGIDSKLRLQYVTAIHSSNPDLHDKMTGIKGSFWDTMEGLDNLIEAGFNVIVKHILNNVTYSNMIETFKYLDEHFPPAVTFEFCGMDYSGNAQKNKNILYASFETLQKYLEQTLDFLIEQNELRKQKGSQHKRRISIMELPLCMLDPYYWNYYTPVNENLHMYLAPNCECTNYTNNNVSSDCNTDYYLCRQCAVKRWCQGVWRSMYKIGGDSLLKPVYEYCGDI